MTRDWIGDVRWALSRASRLVVLASVCAIALEVADPTALRDLGLTLPRLLLAYVSAALVGGTLCGLARPFLSSLLGSALAGFVAGSATAVALSLADYRTDVAELHKVYVLVFTLIGTGSGIATYYKLKERAQAR